MKRVDVVVAVRNEEESLPLFCNSLFSLPLPSGVELGVIFVEDGSTDRTREFLRERAKTDPRVKYLFLQQGRGQAPAIALGIAHSKADAIIMMDVDGGHPLELIPEMVSHYLDGAEAVQAVRRTMVQRKGYRSAGTWLFNRFYRVVTGVDTEIQNVYFRLVSRSIFERLLQNNRWKHFLRINYQGWKPGSVRYVSFDTAERTLGQSKYNFKRLLKFAFIALLSSLSTPRFLSASLILIAVALALYDWPLVSGALVMAMFAVTVFFVQLSRVDITDLLVIQEHQL